MKNTSWKLIRDAIEKDISEGQLLPGEKVPTEPELVERYGAGRHSVRRAISDLAKQGMLSVEQGRGTFVGEQLLLQYSLGRRTRLRRNLGDQVFDISGYLLAVDIIEAPERVRKALNLAAGAAVSSGKRITYADQIPIAFGSAFHDVNRFPCFADRRAVFGSVTETYKSYGIEDYLRSETTLHSRQAKKAEAKTLRQHPDLPVTIISAVDVLPDGTPISFSEVIWSAARVKFTISGNDNE
ncbi:MAG: phosphonate metabolism transcriptional regulator PhnF [Octadecabacter sp.]|nr:phosphonate metabolism transcriptional regulator PhnF [Octadecabacter sp.]